ncbi:MAG: GNAT family N-acetyltransferase [Pseudomonadota bacterium]
MTPALINTPVLETERLTLRAFARQDVKRAMRFLVSERSQYMGGPYTSHDAWNHCASLIGHWAIHGHGIFSICLKGSDDAIGDVGPYFPEGWVEKEIGWDLWDPEFEGKRYATEAALAAREYAFGTLGWTTAVSYIDPKNANSIGVAKRLGCTLDDTAGIPQLPDWEGTLVYRHPSPKGMTE